MFIPKIVFGKLLYILIMITYFFLINKLLSDVNMMIEHHINIGKNLDVMSVKERETHIYIFSSCLVFTCIFRKIL